MPQHHIMKHNLLRTTLFAASLSLAPLAFAESTAFTWQGRLSDTGQPADGLYDLRFTLHDSLDGGLALGTNTFPGTDLSNGLYTATLDFGADAFNGDARWLELALRTNGAAAYTTLAPRQAVTPTPYAIRAANAGSVSGTIPDAQLSANVARLNATNAFTGPVTAPQFLGGGSGLSGVAPASGSTNYVAKAGDTMTGSLRLDLARPMLMLNETTLPQWWNMEVTHEVATSGDFALREDSLTGDIRMLVQKDTGNVGIGTTAPSAPLDVAGKGRFHSLAMVGNDSFGVHYEDWPVSSIGIRRSDQDLNRVTVASFGFRNDPDWLTDDSVANIRLYDPAQAPNAATSSSTTQLRIASPGPLVLQPSSGNVGIGTADPQAVLDVVGANPLLGPVLKLSTTDPSPPDAAFVSLVRADNLANPTAARALLYLKDHANNYPLEIENQAGATLFAVNGNGNVGIGTASPSKALEVQKEVLIVGNDAGGTEYSDWPIPSLSIRRSDNYALNGVTMMSFGYRSDPNLITDDSVANIRLVDPSQAPNAATSASTTQLRIASPGSIVLQPTSGNVGIGTASPTAKLEVAGSFKVSGAGNSITTPILSITGGSDVAEPFAMSGGEIPPGAVVVIDAAHPGQLKLSGEAYDKRVAGIVSGAGGVNPGLTLSQRELVAGGQNVALTGRVYALADAANGPIEPGDLLTTSAVPGHAMKVTDHAIAQGAILGKAMSRLESGQGLVLVLVTLQ